MTGQSHHPLRYLTKAVVSESHLRLNERLSPSNRGVVKNPYLEPSSLSFSWALISALKVIRRDV
jgi:hypothetical protein